MEELTHTVEVHHGGMRLDALWQAVLEERGIARSRVQAWIRAGQARVDGQKCRKPAQKLMPGQRLSLALQTAPPGVQARPGNVDVIFHDPDLIVVNKPASLIVHPAPSVDEPTLVHYLAHAFPELLRQGGDRPGVVHRLDKDTSGLMAVALSDPARLTLTRAFATRTVYKEYLALVTGVPRLYGQINLPLGRHPVIKTRMAVVDSGRTARTEYRVVWSAPDQGASLVRVLLHTGRTHQIRVHLAALGHPLLGDAVYGDAVTADRAPRQMLHAWQLRLAHPVSGQELDFLLPPPQDFMETLRGLACTPLRVGLTGMSGSGKSTVRHELAKAGLPIFCADEVVAASYRPGGAGWTILRHHFGTKFVPAKDQAVDKGALFAAMADSPSLRREVEALVHPVVRQELHGFHQAHPGVSVAEIPLLCEAGLLQDVDALAVVFCPTQTRIDRLTKERGWSPECIALVDSWQWSQQDKLRQAQFIVDNSGSVADLVRQGQALAQVLRCVHERRVQRVIHGLTRFMIEPSTFVATEKTSVSPA